MSTMTILYAIHMLKLKIEKFKTLFSKTLGLMTPYLLIGYFLNRFLVKIEHYDIMQKL